MFPSAKDTAGRGLFDPTGRIAAAASTCPVGPSVTGYARHATTTWPGSYVPTVISVGPRWPAGGATRASCDIHPVLVLITRTASCRLREYAITARPAGLIP